MNAADLSDRPGAPAELRPDVQALTQLIDSEWILCQREGLCSSQPDRHLRTSCLTPSYTSIFFERQPQEHGNRKHTHTHRHSHRGFGQISKLSYRRPTGLHRETHSVKRKKERKSKRPYKWSNCWQRHFFFFSFSVRTRTHAHTSATGAANLLHVQPHQHASLDGSMIHCSRQVRGHRVEPRGGGGRFSWRRRLHTNLLSRAAPRCP